MDWAEPRKRGASRISHPVWSKLRYSRRFASFAGGFLLPTGCELLEFEKMPTRN